VVAETMASWLETHRASGGDQAPAPASEDAAHQPPASASRDDTSDVDAMLAAAERELPDDLPEGRPWALVVPHAGYVYSGATASRAYALLRGQPAPDRIVLIGPAHRAALPGECSLCPCSAYRTPLGTVPVDGAACERLGARRPFTRSPVAHESEHCLEVQLPFLQRLWDEVPPIVPVLTGQLGPGECRAAAEALADVLTDESLLVVSTDFTHYGPRFGYVPFARTPPDELSGRIRALDLGAAELLVALDARGWSDYCAETGATICGRRAVRIMLEVAARMPGARGRRLGWANSGQRTGDYTDCVSYVAAAVWRPAPQPSAAP